MQENVEIGQNLERKINEVIQQDYKDLFFRHFVDKEKNFFLVVMYEALEKKFEVKEKKILEFTIYDWSCKNEESVYYISTNAMFGIELLKKYDREEDMHFDHETRTFIEITMKTLLRLKVISEIKSCYFPIIYQKTGYWIDV